MVKLILFGHKYSGIIRNISATDTHSH